MAVKNLDSYFTVHGWMSHKSGLDLHGGELLVFACIYAFDTNRFTGKQKYIAELTGQDVRSVRNNADKLIKRGYIKSVYTSTDTGRDIYYHHIPNAITQKHRRHQQEKTSSPQQEENVVCTGRNFPYQQEETSAYIINNNINNKPPISPHSGNTRINSPIAQAFAEMEAEKEGDAK